MASTRLPKAGALTPAGRTSLLVAFALLAGSCGPSTPPVEPESKTGSPFQFSESAAAEKGVDARAGKSTCEHVKLSDVAASLKLKHSYRNGEEGQSLMVETLGGGCGWLDYDRDGHWDLYLNQGGNPTKPADSAQPGDALFRNLNGAEFVDVTRGARLAEFGYGQGVAVGDFDNDGFEDVYVTNVGANSLWRNLGDGTFEQIAVAAGVADARWSSSAAWADLDHDGDLDLYVCNYLIYDPRHPLDCRTKDGKHRICHPKDLEAWPDECYINQGNGTFTAESRQRGLWGEGNKALGVAIADFNNDGMPDIYVANDTTANFLFLNEGAAKFKDRAHLLGCAADRNGAFQASMGLGVADVDNNGWLDIYSTHFYQESNTLYLNLGDRGFQDATAKLGLHQPTMPFLGFGTAFLDFDQDGVFELLVANGHIENYQGNPLHRMRAQLLAFNGAAWQDCGAAPSDYFNQPHVGRGVAWCDFDNDGDPDVAMIHQNEPLALLRNDSPRGHWLKIEFRGRTANRRGIGCRATVRCQGAEFMQELAGGTTYASSHQPALIFGLGERTQPCEVEIAWPGGKRQLLTDVPLDNAIVVEEPED